MSNKTVLAVLEMVISKKMYRVIPLFLDCEMKCGRDLVEEINKHLTLISSMNQVVSYWLLPH
jgi:hypothetical protein